MCSAFFVTALTTTQRDHLKTTFDPYISLDSVITDWEADELSLNC
jgi:hypothetical protein